MSVNFTQEHLDDLRDAYASGVLEVRHKDTYTRFASPDQLLRAIKEIESRTGKKPRGTHLASVSKGY